MEEVEAEETAGTEAAIEVLLGVVREEVILEEVMGAAIEVEAGLKAKSSALLPTKRY